VTQAALTGATRSSTWASQPSVCCFRASWSTGQLNWPQVTGQCHSMPLSHRCPVSLSLSLVNTRYHIKHQCHWSTQDVMSKYHIVRPTADKTCWSEIVEYFC